MRHLWQIMNITWQDKIANMEILHQVIYVDFLMG